MSESYKICPICKTPNHRNAAICQNCGTSLDSTETTLTNRQTASKELQYDYHFGETDLYEGSLYNVGQRYLLAMFGLLLVLMFGGLALAFGGDILSSASNINLVSNAASNTPTSRPTLNLPTVTQAPPTLTRTFTPIPSPSLTPTATREPCYREVQSGDTLYGLANACGHLSFDILNLIVEINDSLDSVDTPLQIGQVIEIPWPTETPDPNAIQPPTADANAEGEASSNQQQVSAFDENFDPLFVPTATLQAGVMFHIVQPGENILSIAVQYGANVEILSQLNPEVAFSQCDYGLDSGGPSCTVLINQGQQLRVPAPTPTPTLPPTSSGNETATPTPTATFNAPVAQSPSDRANFLRDQLITLRWIPTGTLANNQTYLVKVEDRTAGIVYTAETIETSFIIPQEWQGTDSDRHEYAWTINVINSGDPNNPTFTTETLTFTWESSQ